MKNIVEKRKAFDKAFNLKSNPKPTSIPKQRVLLHYELIKEELEEYLDNAMDKNVIEIADAITDMFYVLTGAANDHGMLDKLELLFNEVHRSNMSKLGVDGKPIYREDGKVLKGPNYSKPNLAPILEIDKVGSLNIFDSDVAFIEKLYDINLHGHNHDKDALKKQYQELINKMQNAINNG